MKIPFIQSFRRNQSKTAASNKAWRAVVLVEALEARALLSGTTCSMASGDMMVANQSSILPASQADESTAPAFTSSRFPTLTAGTAGSFTITTTGTPVSAIKEVGTLPSGVTFVDNNDGTATLSGTPAADSGGLYVLTLHARNGTAFSAKQTLKLTVGQAPLFTSANNITFGTGTASSFKVKTTGYPIGAITETGTLPIGVTFVDDGNGKAKLSGTPASDSAGVYVLKIHAKNGTAPNARQTFTLTVTQTGTAPAFTSDQTAVSWGTGIDYAAGASFPPVTFTTSGTPTAALTETGVLPSGVHFLDNNNGTATLSGTPAQGTARDYALTISAANGISPAADLVFNLTVFNY